MWLTMTFAVDLAEEVVSMAIEGAKQDRGMPWWFWLLFILLILVLWGLWWLIGPGARKRARPGGRDRAAAPQPAPPPTADPVVPPGPTPTEAPPAPIPDRPTAEEAHEPSPERESGDEEAGSPEPPAPPEAPTQASAHDDLTRLAGIGPKVAQILQEAGIRSFAQLAAADVEELRRILRQAGLRFMDPSTWPEQAALAAQEEWDALDRLQSRLRQRRRRTP